MDINFQQNEVRGAQYVGQLSAVLLNVFLFVSLWILTLSVSAIHNVKCASCKTTPVHGPRFSCLRCARYHQCQACFFLGKTSNRHKLKHPVREYCTKVSVRILSFVIFPRRGINKKTTMLSTIYRLQTSSREVTKLILELIRNKLRLCPTQTVAMHLDEPPPDAL